MSAAAREVNAWQLPAADGAVLARHRRGEDLRGLEREAWQAGYADGKEAAARGAREERQRLLGVLQDQTTRLADLLDYMSEPLAELEQQVESQLVRLCALIARQVVRRELQAQPEEIIGALREALALLPPVSRDVRVHLHPDDARLVNERLADAAHRRWQLIEDPVLSRGGCLVNAEYSTIDARVEQRIGAAVAKLLGDERESAPAPATASANSRDAGTPT